MKALSKLQLDTFCGKIQKKTLLQASNICKIEKADGATGTANGSEVTCYRLEPHVQRKNSRNISVSRKSESAD